MNRRGFLKALPFIPLAAVVPLKDDQQEFTAGTYVVRFPRNASPHQVAKLRDHIQEWKDNPGKILCVSNEVEILRA